jgi:hypothetical protein
MDQPDSPPVVPGGCLCGAVQFVVTLPVKWCAHCHCAHCRRAHSAPLVTWIGVESAQFRLTEGDADLAWHASSPGARRGFCRRCGTPMLFESERWPSETHVALVSLAGPIDRAPQAHVYFDQRVPWLEVTDLLPTLGGPSGVEPLPGAG